jgi:hypothetical protein
MITQSNRIIGEIAAEKEVLGQNLQELETRVRSVADWRGHVQRRPLAMMGLAVGGGILLSALVGSPRRRKRRVVSNEQVPDDRRTEPVSAVGPLQGRAARRCDIEGGRARRRRDTRIPRGIHARGAAIALIIDRSDSGQP